MGKKKDILNYLLTYGKENKYKLARALRMSVHKVAKILLALENEGKIEIKTGKAGIKGKVIHIKPKIKKKKVKVKKRKLPEMKEELEGKLPESEEIGEEEPIEEVPEDMSTREQGENEK